MRSEPAGNATVEHMEILDAGVQQGLVGESGPEKSSVVESGEKTCLLN